MIDVIGTDAGAPASLPTAQQQLIREAHWIAAPRRLQPALNAWLNQPKPLIASDAPRLLVDALQDLDATAPGVVLASGYELWAWVGMGLEVGDGMGHLGRRLKAQRPGAWVVDRGSRGAWCALQSASIPGCR